MEILLGRFQVRGAVIENYQKWCLDLMEVDLILEIHHILGEFYRLGMISRRASTRCNAV
jgi:hypothetical protein